MPEPTSTVASPVTAPAAQAPNPSDASRASSASTIPSPGRAAPAKPMSENQKSARSKIAEIVATAAGKKPDEADAEPEGQTNASPAPASTAAAKEPTAAEKAAADPKAAERKKSIADANRVLARDQWTPAMLGKLSDDELLEHSALRREAQANQDRMGNRLRDAARPGQAATPDAGKKPEGQATGDAKTDPPAGQSAGTQIGQHSQAPADADDAALWQQLQEMVGPNATPLLKKIVDGIEQRHAATAQQSSSAAIEAARSAILHAAKTELRSDYPGVENTDDWNEVVENAAALARSGRYKKGQESKLWNDAALLHFGNSAVEQSQRRILERQKLAQDGRVDPGPARAQPATAMTGKEKAKRAQELLRTGKYTSEQVRVKIAALP